MAEAYFNADDLFRYLDRSICLYEGVPVYVQVNNTARFPQVALYRLQQPMQRAWKIVDHTDSALDDRSPSLGYMNADGKTYYLTRVPIRTQAQGIKQALILGNPHVGTYLDSGHPWFTAPCFEDCILGKHPSLKEAWDLLEGDATGVAIHRHLALVKFNRKTTGLHYKGRLVAHWNPMSLQWDYFHNNDTTHMEKVIRKLGVL